MLVSVFGYVLIDVMHVCAACIGDGVVDCFVGVCVIGELVARYVVALMSVDGEVVDVVGVIVDDDVFEVVLLYVIVLLLFAVVLMMMTMALLCGIIVVIDRKDGIFGDVTVIVHIIALHMLTIIGFTRDGIVCTAFVVDVTMVFDSVAV